MTDGKSKTIPSGGHIIFSNKGELIDFLSIKEQMGGRVCITIPSNRRYNRKGVGLRFIIDENSIVMDSPEPSIKCTLIHNDIWWNYSVNLLYDQDRLLVDKIEDISSLYISQDIL